MQIKAGEIPDKIEAIKGRPLSYPFDKLEAGKFLLLSKEEEAKRLSIMQAARQYAKRKGWIIKIRTVNKQTQIHRIK